MTDSELLTEIRRIVDQLPRRGREREKAAAINQIKMLLLSPNNPYIEACSMCGHLIDISPMERGTHVEHGYREPHIQPWLPGSFLYEEEKYKK